jgi:hypothetical protein
MHLLYLRNDVEEVLRFGSSSDAKYVLTSSSNMETVYHSGLKYCHSTKWKLDSVNRGRMSDTGDTAPIIVRRPLALGRAAIAGLMLGWFLPLQFLPAKLPGRWLGAAVFVLAFALFAWAVATMTRVSPDIF